ncbi:MAG TPA: hypothetical protein VMI10_11770 [Terriglobales bacterium]|nr:hypothetical protein [Terriglobales bacterium]
MLLVYMLECMWLIRAQTLHGFLPESDHALCIYDGLAQWKTGLIAATPETLRTEAATGLGSAGRAGRLRVRDGYDVDRSPYYYLTAAAPVLAQPPELAADSAGGQVWIAAPYLFFGVMMGASLWYVSRRLYGNIGGYIALSLYCFSPGIILATAGTQNLGEMSGTWGTFGIVFTGIAVAHTLYAPREVVLWNARRILLLGLSVALAVGTQFSLVAVLVAILPIMLWVAPVRPRAVLAIWGAAVAVGVVLLAASYFFRFGLFWQAMLRARWVDIQPRAFGMTVSYGETLKALAGHCPALIIALPAALGAYFGWRRARYFGNTAPLLMAILLFVLAVASPDFSGQGFRLAILTFLFVFVAGVMADLVESAYGSFVTAGIASLVGAAGLWNLVELWRVR